MLLPIFAIYDSKALYYGPPFIQQNVDMGKRAFADIVNEPGNPIHAHPSDFSLIEIGTYDDEKGVIVDCDHVNHGLAISYKG